MDAKDDVLGAVNEWSMNHDNCGIEVRMEYVHGAYYRTQPPRWRAETDRFIIGPRRTLQECLDELDELMKASPKPGARV